MDVKEIKAFPADFTQWINANVSECEAGKKVLDKWGIEVETIARMVEAVGPIDFEWGMQLCEFKNAGVHDYIGWKLNVKIMDVSPAPQVTYVFHLDDNNRIIDWTKYKGGIASDVPTTLQ